ncbi:FAD-binding oxidoreductase [Gordonia rhizosphera]|uniref:Putative FAD-linked oxidase n=1 Tax=Gordonia rhizosphera NBRC 16068 TaxID=1108045 RepID=K6WL51_9ACTN|nr:FAD-binding oxidoreductase [Gordonia rhizosphera]GAB92847.1 putative FAD-linked oxidase [Gordonia rhizosphera NBRC 16068]
MQPFLDECRAVVGDAHVLTDPQAMAGFLTDWTGRWTGHAEAVIRPRTTDEVAAVMRICSSGDVDVCVQGGNTGLVGGSVPPSAAATGRPAVLLSTTRMTDIDDIDTVGRCVGVQAGATIDAIDTHAARSGLMFPIDLASRESATAGGVVATNAGGTRMIRHGNTRAQVLGIEAVLADGRLLRRWSSLVKDNVGYDVPGLLAGSEGTLAVITRVLFALASPPPATTVTVVAIDHVETALDLIGLLRSAGLTIEAAEIMTQAGVDLVHEHGQRRPVSTSAPFYALIEVSGVGEVESEMIDVLERADGIVDAVLEPGPARALWAARENHTEAISRSTTTPVVKLDVSFPLRALPEAFGELSAIEGLVGHPCRAILFGHVGDGNIHVNLLDVPPERTEEITARVFAVVAVNGGSISAEHGIGRAKTAWTHLGRSEVDRTTMRAIKTTLDPQGLLNPGVLFG